MGNKSLMLADISDSLIHNHNAMNMYISVVSMYINHIAAGGMHRDCIILYKLHTNSF